LKGNPIAEEDNTMKKEEVSPRPAPEDRPVIRACCEFYACRVCRTKTGWPHQKWCELRSVAAPDCADCRYWEAEAGACEHPVHRGRGVGAK